jgi:hypothetical protein
MVHVHQHDSAVTGRQQGFFDRGCGKRRRYLVFYEKFYQLAVVAFGFAAARVEGQREDMFLGVEVSQYSRDIHTPFMRRFSGKARDQFVARYFAGIGFSAHD